MEVEAGCPEAARKVYEEGSAHCPRSVLLSVEGILIHLLSSNLLCA